jgi:hypothetical protein
LVARLASEFNLEVELKNIILVAFRFFEFLHNRVIRDRVEPTASPAMSAMPSPESGFMAPVRMV